jgi:hypothetical protein
MLDNKVVGGGSKKEKTACLHMIIGNTEESGGEGFPSGGGGEGGGGGGGSKDGSQVKKRIPQLSVSSLSEPTVLVCRYINQDKTITLDIDGLTTFRQLRNRVAQAFYIPPG